MTCVMSSRRQTRFGNARARASRSSAGGALVSALMTWREGASEDGMGPFRGGVPGSDDGDGLGGLRSARGGEEMGGKVTGEVEGL